jgi:hypothetical protein
MWQSRSINTPTSLAFRWGSSTSLAFPTSVHSFESAHDPSGILEELGKTCQLLGGTFSVLRIDGS